MGQDDPLEFTSQPASLLSELQASDRPCLKKQGVEAGEMLR